MKPGRRGLGRQAPAVLAKLRQAPGVLAKIGAAAPPEAQAVRALQVSMGRLKTEHEELRADLGDALDGWEALAGAADQDRIDTLRKRWGLRAIDPEDTDRDVTEPGPA